MVVVDRGLVCEEMRREERCADMERISACPLSPCCWVVGGMGRAVSSVIER